MTFVKVLTCFAFAHLAMGYIPAVPSNDSALINQSINQSDTSMLQLQWFPNASFGETVSLQLVGQNSTGRSEGAFVQFSETDISESADGTPNTSTNPPDFTTTPWIAFISCDANVTKTTDVDVFTLAKARGALAAVIYSQWSDACILNSAFANPAIFSAPLDVYATKSLIAARTVLNSFTNINQTAFGSFNATTLNQSASIISESITNNAVSDPSFLLGSLSNSSFASTNSTSTPGAGSSSGDGNARPSSKMKFWTTVTSVLVVYYTTMW